MFPITATIVHHAAAPIGPIVPMLPYPQPPLLPVPMPLPLITPQPFHPYIHPTHKTIHILSYSLARLNAGDPIAHHLLYTHRPVGVPPLLTVHCERWRAPPRHMCEAYSGVSGAIQQFVEGSRTARRDM